MQQFQHTLKLYIRVKILSSLMLPFRLENGDAEGRQAYLDMARLMLPGHGGRLPAGRVGDAAAAVFRLVCIEDFAIEARFRHADVVVLTGDGSEVAHHDQMLVRVARAPQKTDHRVIRIVEIDPLKTLPIKIDFVK